MKRNKYSVDSELAETMENEAVNPHQTHGEHEEPKAVQKKHRCCGRHRRKAEAGAQPVHTHELHEHGRGKGCCGRKGHKHDSAGSAEGCCGEGHHAGHGHAHGKGGCGQHGHHFNKEMFKGRKFTAEEMQLLLLHFLQESPSYGYQIIKRFEELSQGLYMPSPGVIYPALTYLDEAGYLEASAEGNRKQYALTAEGQAYLANNSSLLNEPLQKLAQFAEKAQHFKQFFQGENSITEDIKEVLAGVQHAYANLEAHTVEEHERLMGLLKGVIDRLDRVRH